MLFRSWAHWVWPSDGPLQAALSGRIDTIGASVYYLVCDPSARGLAEVPLLEQALRGQRRAAGGGEGGGGGGGGERAGEEWGGRGGRERWSTRGGLRFFRQGACQTPRLDARGDHLKAPFQGV